MSNTLTEYARPVRLAFERLDELATTRPLAGEWWSELNSATDTAPLSLKAFLENHDELDTLQVSFDGDAVRGIWSPGYREIETRATYANFDGSRRDYAGVVHIAHNNTAGVWVGYDKTSATLLAYRSR